jgi:hypothetical protein
MSIPLQPLSPSARQFRQQPSPTSPSYAEHQFKRTLLDDVKNWSEQRVSEWLSNQALGRFSQKFIGKRYISSFFFPGEKLLTIEIRTQHLGFSVTRLGL